MQRSKERVEHHTSTTPYPPSRPAPTLHYHMLRANQPNEKNPLAIKTVPHTAPPALLPTTPPLPLYPASARAA